MAKRTILATKLQEEDSLVDVRVVNENKHGRSSDKERVLFEIPGHGSSYKEKSCSRCQRYPSSEKR